MTEVETLEARVSAGEKPFGTVLTYGTFDLFHVGHVRLLRRLVALGERLVVGVSTDAFNAQKGKSSVMPYHDRAEILLACEYVSEVIPEENWGQKRQDIERVGADVFAMGDDWAGKFDDLSDLCKVLYLPRTENISSTDLKASVAAQAAETAVAAE
ncbi:adenylyltransferase/cytidyltransferase family protein [Rhodobacteraceae bacterium D3-12]|nr:adenylyltransferase/cytidyltransferase family protein [Rhodobacteraceae bacterium D3-12]